MIKKLTVLPTCIAKTSASVTQPQKIAIHFCVLQFYLRFGSSAGFHLHLVVGPDSRAVSASPFNDARHHVLGLDICRLDGLFYQPFPEQRPLFPNSQSPIGTQVSRKTQRKHPVVWSWILPGGFGSSKFGQIIQELLLEGVFRKRQWQRFGRGTMSTTPAANVETVLDSDAMKL